jgi:hypothetical protein
MATAQMRMTEGQKLPVAGEIALSRSGSPLLIELFTLPSARNRVFVVWRGQNESARPVAFSRNVRVLDVRDSVALTSKIDATGTETVSLIHLPR